ncbi:hypothetical protein GCM10020331_012820 [Ectobacillus funiculus]
MSARIREYSHRTKKLGSQGRDEITVFELNYANEKVKHVQEKEKKAQKKAAKGISNS